MRLFVYGTLKKGFNNHHFLQDATYIEEATIKGTLLNLGWFPGYIPEGEGEVHGEVYEINDEILKRIDHLEGHPDFYTRKDVGDFSIYYYNKQDGVQYKKVAGGQWS